MDRRAQGPLALWLDCCPLPLSSLWEPLPGLRLCLQLLVSGVWDVCGWLFCILVLLSALCSSNSGTIFFDAQMFNGFQEKRFENLPSRDSLKVGCLGSKDELFWLTTQVLEELEGLCTRRSPSLEASRG